MTRQELMNEVSEILTKAKTAVLATVDKDGKPHMRWMSPTILRDNPQAIYAVTNPHAIKLGALQKDNQVEWLVQPRTIETVISLRGKINVIENPSLNAQLMEVLARRLNVFWKVNHDELDFVVLETVIEEATYFKPMKGTYEVVKF